MWDQVRLENFFRSETMWSDEKCKKVAKALSKDGIIDLLKRVDPTDYSERKE